VGDVLLAADRWTTNGHLIAAVLDQYVPTQVDVGMDVTWGRGRWWTIRPPEDVCRTFIRHDRDKLDGIDFRALPEPDGSADLITLDPPYIAQGGRKTSTLGRSKHSPDDADFLDRYGLVTVPRTPREVQRQIDDGVTEAHRVLRVGGLLLVKCKDYINGSRLVTATIDTPVHARSLGFEVVDRFEHIASSAGPQPQHTKCRHCAGTGVDTGLVEIPCDACAGQGSKPRGIEHARRNLSTLFVLRKTKRSRITIPPPPPGVPT
jgi:hypothetical protein